MYLKISNKNSSASSGKLFGLIFIFFSLTPWASWGINNLDSQPWPFLSSIIYLAFRFSKIKVPATFISILFWVIFIVLFSAALFDIASEVDLVRAFVSYVSIPLVLIAFYDFLKTYGAPVRLVVYVNILWLSLGFIELFVPELVSWTSPMRTTADRGVTSLSPEPTFFGVYLIFSSWLLLALKDYKPNSSELTLIVANIIAIIFLAKSSMATLFIPFLLFVWYLRRYGVSLGFFVFVFLIIVCFSSLVIGLDYFLIVFEGTRMGRMLKYAFSQSLMNVIFIDASINVRFEHVVVPFYAFFENVFLPHGFDSYGEVRTQINSKLGGFFWYGGDTNKIMSWVGAIVFETGVLGVIFIALLLSSVWKNTCLRIIELLVILVLLVSAIPLAFSLVPLLLAIFRYNGER